MNKRSANIVIVGGGPAGLAAARAASPLASVMIVDDNPNVGGQIWRAELGRHKLPEASATAQSVARNGIELLTAAEVYSVGDSEIVVDSAGQRAEIRYEKLIIATGARERFLPFRGWTLPNVMGAGGLQAMVKGGLNIAGKRVVIAGTGPLLLAVAEYLKRKGAVLSAIVEQAPAAKLNRFGVSLIVSPAKLKQALTLKTKLLGVPYFTDSWVTTAKGNERLESVEITRKGKTWSVECDFLACGYHLVPNLELPRLLGCDVKNGAVVVDEFQQTSITSVFAAGETTGIAGIESALIEGEVAGLAAGGRIDDARRLFAKRDKAVRFGSKMNEAFKLRDELRSLADAGTIVCRCEDVRFDRLTEFKTFREAKLQTRCGMGPCQGRICGTAAEFLFNWEPASVREPIFPVKMENL
jgi:NADPH-dependent 2,4-dienoyl-CoA reductase/sulfur reductase-like enzyme